MKTKEIIKKLEAVVCELKETEIEQAQCEEKEIYSEYLDDKEEWIKSYLSVYRCETFSSHSFICKTDKYKYYGDMDSNMLYRIKR